MNKWKHEYKHLPKSHKIALACIGLGDEATELLLAACEQEEAELISYWYDRLQGSPMSLIEMALEEFADLLDTDDEELLQIQKPQGIGDTEVGVQHLYQANGETLRDEFSMMSGRDIALRLFYIRLDRAVMIMEALSFEKQIEAVLGFEEIYDLDAKMRTTLLMQVAEKMGNVGYYDYVKDSNALETIASILEGMPHAMRRRLLEEVHRRDANLSTRLKNQTFLFENIYPLTRRQIKELAAEADSIDLFLTVYEADPNAKEKVLSTIDPEQREKIIEKVAKANHITPRQIEQAQLRVGRVVHQILRSKTAKTP